MHIPLVDLRAQYQMIKHEAMASFEDVLEHIQLFLGPQCQAFEQEFAAYCGCQWNVVRQRHAWIYTEQLQNVGEAVPVVRTWGTHVYYVSVVQVQDRDHLREVLEQEGIATGIHYPTPIHLQPGSANIATNVEDYL
jgi:dTDP-4-amino-4,6-dideoxygalactose transaminase